MMTSQKRDYTSLFRELNKETIQLLNDYINAYNISNILAEKTSRMKVAHAAQEGFTVSTDNGGIAFRVLMKYKRKKDKKECLAINFPNWRGWEKNYQ